MGAHNYVATPVEPIVRADGAVVHPADEYKILHKSVEKPANPLLKIIRYHAQCTGVTEKGLRCAAPAMGGADLCYAHQKSTLSNGRVRLLSLINPALIALEECLDSLDDKVKLAAAKIVLDRTGFGPQMVLKVDDASDDLAALSVEELRERRQRIIDRATRFVGSGTSADALDISVDESPVNEAIEEAGGDE